MVVFYSKNKAALLATVDLIVLFYTQLFMEERARVIIQLLFMFILQKVQP